MQICSHVEFGAMFEHVQPMTIWVHIVRQLIALIFSPVLQQFVRSSAELDMELGVM